MAEKGSGSSPLDDQRSTKADLSKRRCSPDLLFLLDTTSSIEPYLKAFKGQFKALVDDIKRVFKEAEVRIAMVGYKDHSDTPNIEFLDFTLSTDRVRLFLEKLVAIGGDDVPEDVLGGIRQALKATWKQETRWIFHIADAPPHSRTLHDFYGFCDNYFEPGSEPHGLAFEPLLKQMIRLDINYALFRINDFTDRMVFEFFKAYNAVSADAKLCENNRFYSKAYSMPKGVRSSFWDEESSKRSAKATLQFKEVLPDSRVSSFRRSIFNIVTASAPRVEEEDDGVNLGLEKTLPQWGIRTWFDETLKAAGFSAEIVKANKALTLNDMMAHDNNIRISSINLTVFKRSRPFAQGAMRQVFYAHTEASNNRFVIKQGRNQLACFFEDMRCRSLCKAFALEFNGLLDLHKPIDFIVATCVMSKTGEYLSLEPFIEGDFIIYNNNRGLVNSKFADKFNQTAQAFSHFTFERSSGSFLVCNLLGVGYLLTNPSIHTRDTGRFQLRGTNLGLDGFKFFFSTHTCNEICGHLGLKSKASKIMLGTCQFQGNWAGMVYAVCCSNKLCGKIMHFCHTRELDKFPGYLWCNVCSEQLLPSSVKLVCEEPGAYHDFQVSRFYFESQGQQLPNKCVKHSYEITTTCTVNV